jgi:hypothetical protein
MWCRNLLYYWVSFRFLILLWSGLAKAMETLSAVILQAAGKSTEKLSEETAGLGQSSGARALA